MKFFYSLTLQTFLLLLALAGMTSACNSSKILQGQEKLLKKNLVNLDISKKQANVRNLKYELSTLYKQVPNTRLFFFIRREVIYYNNSQEGDTTRYKKYLKNKIGEKPVIFDAAEAAATARSMEFYLNNKGFFNAKVDYEVKPEKHSKVKVIYNAVANDVYKVDSVFVTSEDTRIQEILNRYKTNAILKPGQPVSDEVFDGEVRRITKRLRNSGYYFFDRNFITSLGDSTDNKVKVYLEVLTPVGKTEHPFYYIGKINVYPDYQPANQGATYLDTIVDGIQINYSRDKISIKPQTLTRSIYMKTGELYREDDLVKSNLQLSNLNNFNTISIRPKVDTAQLNVLNIDIFLTAKKQLEIGFDWELNNSNYTLLGARTSLLGTSAGVNYKNWNANKNATLFDTKLQGGVEFDINQFGKNDTLSSLIYSADASVSTDWYFPKFVHWTGPYGLLNKIPVGYDENHDRKKLLQGFYTDLLEKSRTRLSLGFNFRNITTLYTENTFNAAFGYEVQRNPNHRIIIDQTGVNYFNQFNRKPAFDTILAENPYLEKQLGRQLFTGFLFRNFNYIYTGKANRFGESWYFGGSFELSGLEIWAANSIYNNLSNKVDTFQLFNNIDFSQYARTEADLRYYRQFNDKQSVAFRFNTGIALPFGFSRNTGTGSSSNLPYVKQFFVGGPNSIRAWRIRELGPGGFVNSTQKDNKAFFQAADFKLQFNAEYRFKIIDYLNGALFIDGGNIWTLKAEDDRPNGEFHLIPGVNGDGDKTIGFLNEMALGTGFGFRLEFPYVVVSVDLGIKLRTPTPDEDGKYWFPKWDKYQLRDINPNLWIGYPF